MAEPLASLVRFGRALRDEGLPVGTGRIAAFCEAAALLAPVDLYWAGRATLVSRGEELLVYDRVFRSFFADEERPPAPRTARPVRLVAGRADSPLLREGAESPGEPDLGLASRVEVLRRKSFAHCTAEELDELAVLMGRIELAVPSRRSPRHQPARSGAPDLRRTLRRSFRTGGEPLERAWRERKERRRRLVLLLDVSRSMAPYSRPLPLFAPAPLRADPRWEAFCFGTRLTRVTRALALADPDAALRRAAAEVFDWEGGTRIGESLKAFLDRFGHGGMARGAVVVICSDGLDTGDPVLVGEQMARLSRLAHRVVWLNPLKEDPAYEPLARGMEAALPYLDVFAAGHNLASLEELADELTGVAPASR